MKKRTKILIGVVVIVIVLIAIVAVAGSDDDDNKVRYNYEIELTKSFVTGSGYTEAADAGEQYAIVTWTVANDSYSDGFNTNGWVFEPKIVVNGVTYAWSSWETVSYPGYALKEIKEGYSDSFVYVYEIPDTVTLSDMTMEIDFSYSYGQPHMGRDTSL